MAFAKGSLRYRDDLTEGYNITPNFFIYGYIKDYKNFDQTELDTKGEIVKSFHFENRLFDRDTMFVHQYKINFLYVLKSYTQFGNQTIEKFRTEIKTMFRNNFVDFFSTKDKSKFELYEYQQENIEDFIETNFRIINGKCFKTIDNKLILAKYENDNTLDILLSEFKPFNLT